jgi:uncharacterized membrane protein YdjX (TVP38/TMEM64 family)
MKRVLPALTAIVLILLALLAAIAARLPSVARFATEAAEVSAANVGMTHWLMFLGVQVGVAAIGFVPASLMAVTAGATYGIYQGFLISSVGLMAGGSLAFILSRSVLRPWVERLLSRHPRFIKLEQAVGPDDWRFVCLVRLSPVMPFALTSYCLGLTTVNHRAFSLGTLASLPALACFVAIGALGRAGWQAGTTNAGYINLALIAMGLIATVFVALRVKKALA